MRLATLLASLGLAGLAGAGTYAWAMGAHWPCETLGRMSGSGQCTRLLALDGRSLQGMDLLPNGNILAGTRGHGPKPDRPLSLIEINPATGAIVAETQVDTSGAEATPDGLSASTSFGQVAVSADGNLVAVTALGMKTTILDRQGRVQSVLDRVLPAFVAFDPEGRLLLEMGHNTGGVPDVERTQVFDLSDPTAAPTALVGKPPPNMFAAGVGTALSGDGRFFAQEIKTIPDSGAAAVRLGPMTDRARAGLLLAARLRPGCGYLLPSLAFSPDGRKLAVSFQCPSRLGTESSALIVWDHVEQRILARIPSQKGWDRPLWLDDSKILVRRYDPDSRLAELFVIRAGARR